jgi:catechol 2,3-dioxygenase-like lactoylglutathione lyase family enzyme
MAIALGTVGIIVKDMQKTLAFYRLLGLDIPPVPSEEPNADVELPGGITIGFLSESVARMSDPSYITPVGGSLNLQFLCDSAVEVDATHARLTAAGYRSHAEPSNAPWGQRFARVVDPDGRVVNLYAALA